MRRTLGVLAVGAVVVAALAACTGDSRCDAYTKATDAATAWGWSIDCAPPFPGQMANGQAPLGWTDHATLTMYVWPDRIPSDAGLRKVMAHELGHVYASRHGLHFPSQSAEEHYADAWAYCFDRQLGVGYLERPTDCRAYGFT